MASLRLRALLAVVLALASARLFAQTIDVEPETAYCGRLAPRGSDTTRNVDSLRLISKNSDCMATELDSAKRAMPSPELGKLAAAWHAQARRDFARLVKGDTSYYPHAHVFASGDLKSVVGQSSDATATTGSLGVAYEGTRFVVTAAVNVAAKVDTVHSSFGASMLTPASGGSFDAGLLDIRIWHLFNGSRPEECFSDVGTDAWRCNIGFRVAGSASSLFWRDKVDTLAPAINVTTWALYGGAFYAFTAGKIVGRDLRVELHADLVERAVRGNLLSKQDTAKHEFYLHTRHSDFYGQSFALLIVYSDLHASLEYVKMNGAIDGFSRGQVVASIAIQTDLVSGIIRGARP